MGAEAVQAATYRERKAARQELERRTMARLTGTTGDLGQADGGAGLGIWQAQGNSGVGVVRLERGGWFP